MSGIDVYTNTSFAFGTWSNTLVYTPPSGDSPASVQVGGLAPTSVTLNGSVAMAGAPATVTVEFGNTSIQQQLQAVCDIVGGGVFTDGAGDYYLFADGALSQGATPRMRGSLLRQLGGRRRLDSLSNVLFEATGPGMVAVDRRGRIVRTNARLREMMGQRADLSAGAPATHLFGSAERAQVSDEIRLALAGRAPRPDFVTRLDDPQGGPGAVVSACVLALRDPQARRANWGPEKPAPVVGALLILADITRQRQLEAQLAQSQKLQAVGSLAGGIALDFNNLLTAVQCAAEAIATRSGLDRDTIEDLAQICSSVGRGSALVQQLLAFGRQQTMQPRALAANEIVRELSSLLRRLLGSRIRLDLDLEQPGRWVRADPTQLDQVLVNLAVNARNAMPKGGTLTLRTGHLTVYQPQWEGVETIPPGRYVLLEVRDTGEGMAPGVLPRIFDPFFTTRRAQGGNGLGLSTVHGIVRQSSGFLGVDSEPGCGTSFRIYLPRHDGERLLIPEPPDYIPAQDPARAAAVPMTPTPLTPTPLAATLLASTPIGGAAASVPPLSTATNRGTILLVDDEEPVCRLAERALRRQGWEVLSADSGESTLDMLSSAPEMLSAIVSDVMMPGIDGPALIQAVRRLLCLPNLPALLMSGYAEASLRAAMADVSDVAFLAKPYSLKDLAAKLNEVVANPAAVSLAAKPLIGVLDPHGRASAR